MTRYTSTTPEEAPARLLKTKEAARLFGLSTAYLRRDRNSANPRIPVLCLGPRLYRYSPSELKDYLASCGLGGDHGPALDRLGGHGRLRAQTSARRPRI